MMYLLITILTYRLNQVYIKQPPTCHTQELAVQMVNITQI